MQEHHEQQEVQGHFPMKEELPRTESVRSDSLAEAATHGVEAAITPFGDSAASVAQDAETTTAIAHERAARGGVGGQG